ncbi:MAG TPA: DNA polymerase I [Phycisphaerae bacterium]|nr:DNA polymerase I [Phycisphaerae bacterium]
MPSRLYIIDSHGQLYASYYAIPNLTSPKGEPTGATFGFVSTLLKILREEEPDYLVACFDMPGPTHRHEVYAAYKAQRKPMPDDLAVQIERVHEVLGAMGIPVVESPGFEADDCIAAMVERGRKAGLEVVICSRDKDLEQLVGPGVTMLDAKTFDHLDGEGIKKKRGVEPGQMVDMLALMGDASDNIPGVPGIGPKTATKLIAQYGSLDNLLAHVDEVGGKAGESLRANKAKALESRELVRLDGSAPLEISIEACRMPDSFGNATVAALFRDLGFNQFIDDLVVEGGEAQAPIRTHVVDTAEALEKLARALKKQKTFAFDTETTSLSPRRAKLVGLSFAWSGREGYYIPLLGPESKRCLPLEKVAAALRAVLESDQRLLVGQNIKYDLLVCRRAGLDLSEPFFDTMVAAYLVSPGRREYNLDALALDYFGHKMIPLTDLLGEKKRERAMDACPIGQVAEYSVEDACVTWRLKGRLEGELEKAGLSDLARDVEMPLVPVLAAMEETGVAVDTEVLEEIAADLDTRLARLEESVYKEAGHEFKINSPQQLAEVLFEEIGLRPLKKTATRARPSTDARVLDELARHHPLPRLVLAYRQLAKLKGTYVGALPQLVDPESGRIHASFNQAVTATGRLSSSGPNLQNIPIRTDEGRQIRRAFVPGEAGWCLLAADYSQIELRMLAHYSKDKALVRAFAEDRDIHTFVASQIHGVDEADVTPEMRAMAKTVNFSLIYGKTAYGLARDLYTSVGEAEAFIDEYFERYKGVRTFTADVLERAKRDGYVTTILGRRRYIEGIDKMDPKRLNFPERTAINTVIQGSAADLIKVAMNRIWRRIQKEKRPSRLLIQIHDELVFETPGADAEAEQTWIEAEMTGAMDLEVPLKVHMATGKNWMEAE